VKRFGEQDERPCEGRKGEERGEDEVKEVGRRLRGKKIERQDDRGVIAKLKRGEARQMKRAEKEEKWEADKR
jgi:hypothetical protein